MKVSNSVDKAGLAQTEATQTAKAQGADKAKRAKISTTSAPVADNGSARTEISPRAKEMSQAKAAALQAPDVRENRVADLKKRIANKEYDVKPEDIADRLLREHIETNGLS